MSDSVFAFATDNSNLAFRIYAGHSDVFVSICALNNFITARISQEQADHMASEVFESLGYTVKRMSAPRHQSFYFSARGGEDPSLHVEILTHDRKTMSGSGCTMIARCVIRGRELARLSEWLAENLGWELSE